MVFQWSPCRGCKVFKYVRFQIPSRAANCTVDVYTLSKDLATSIKMKKAYDFLFFWQNRKGSVPTWAPSGQIIKIHLWLCTQLKCQGNVLWILGPFFYSARLCTKTNWISVNGTKYVPGTALNPIALSVPRCTRKWDLAAARGRKFRPVVNIKY